MDDLLNKLLQNTPALIATAVVAILLLILIVALIGRLFRKRKPVDDLAQDDLAALERERQLYIAADRAPYLSASAQVAQNIKDTLHHTLSITLLGIYAGHDEEADLQLVSFANGLPANDFPMRIPRSSAPTSIRLLPTETAAFFGASPALAPSSQPSTNLGEMQVNRPIAIFPWRNEFGRQGLLIFDTTPELTPDRFAPYAEAMGKLTSRLAVALEIEEGNKPLDGRPAYGITFARLLPTLMNEPAPFDAVTREVANWLGTDSSAVWLLDPKSLMLHLAGHSGLQAAEFLPLPLGQSLTGTVLHQAKTIAVEDAPTDPRCLFPAETVESGIGAYLGAPLIVGEKKIGVLEAHRRQPCNWTETDITLLESAASLLAECFSATTSSSGAQTETAYLGLSEALQKLQSRSELWDAVVEVFGHALGVSRAVAFELSDGKMVAPVTHEYREGNTQSIIGTSFSELTVTSLLAATAEGKPVALEDSTFNSLLDGVDAERLQPLSEMAIPIIRDGQTRGMVYLQQMDRRRDWQQPEIEFAERVSRQLSLSLSNIDTLDQVRAELRAARDEAAKMGELSKQAQKLIHSIPDPLVTIDLKGNLTFFNAGAKEVLGLTGEDRGKSIITISQLGLADQSLWSQALGSEQVTRLETQLVKAKPVPLTVSLLSSPLRNEQKQVMGHLIILSDIGHATARTDEIKSQIGHLEKQTATYEQALTQSRESEVRLRNALTELQQQLKEKEAIQARKVDDQTLQKAFDNLKADSDQLRRTVQHLLETNRLKSEFIVNSGKEIEASIQSVIGLAEMLENEAYGPLSTQQTEAMESLLTWARKTKVEIETVIEYGTTRTPTKE